MITGGGVSAVTATWSVASAKSPPLSVTRRVKSAAVAPQAAAISAVTLPKIILRPRLPPAEKRSMSNSKREESPLRFFGGGRDRGTERNPFPIERGMGLFIFSLKGASL